MSVRNRFTNPVNASYYDWQVNHDEESEGGRERSVEHTANTASTGLVRQQGDKTPLIKKISGSILHRNQYRRMWEWFELCDTQTIYFKDATGEEWEVLLTAFRPKKVRARNPNDSTIPFHYYTYSLDMEVVRQISGAEFDAGVDP